MLIWWKHQTISKRDLIRTLPFFLLSLVLGLATIWFQQHNAIAGEVVRPEGLASRIASVGWTFWFYLYKNILPIHLTVIYPRWDIAGGSAISFAPLALLLALFAVLWRYRKDWCRGPLLALGSFAIVLSPVLGLMTMAYTRHSLVADHLQYPGMPGIMALIGGSVGAAWTWTRSKHMHGLGVGIAGLAGVIMLALAAFTWQQARIYKDSMSLWTYVIQHNDRAWMAYYNRGTLYSAMNDAHRAIQDYSRTIELKPDYAQAYNNRGVAFGFLKDYDQEIRDCSKAIELNPAHAKAYANRGLAYGRKGEREQAIRDFDKSIALLPTYSPAYINRGITYGQLGDDTRAIQDFSKAIELDSTCAQAYRDRAAAYLLVQQYDKAWADIRKFRQLGGTPSPELIADLTKASGRTE
jgi:lipoprotein NlpI